MHIATVVGARPQFVKAAMVCRALQSFSVKQTLIHTGQHFDQKMSGIFFEEMGIPKPNYHLGIGSLSHGAMTGQMLEAIEQVLLKEKPDWVVVFGDTNSTLAAALAAVKLHIPVAHVEAGLRSYNKQMPEEINRILVDHSSTLLLTPNKKATDCLLKEGIEQDKIVEVGDVMVDAALHFGNSSESPRPSPYILATVHRQENTDYPEKLAEIVKALLEIAKEEHIILPLHPRTEKKLKESGLYSKMKRELELISPVGYKEMLQLERHANVILTDSGGVQKEAYLFKVPCVTLREETEWRELVEVGANCISGVSYQKIIEAYHQMRGKVVKPIDTLFGDGTASLKISDLLIKS